MLRRIGIVWTLLFWAVLATEVLAQAGAGVAESDRADLPAVSEEALSPRNANYEIDVRLDPKAKTLEARQTLVWRNLQSTATDQLWFHLYWNGWRNSRSTWMLSGRLRSRRNALRNPKPEDWSSIEVDHIRVLPTVVTGEGEESQPESWLAADLSGTARYEAPDDGNPDDRTVMVVDLPRAVEPGETVHVELEWRAKIPRTFARTGARDDFFFIAHWFPILGVYEPEGWNCHQFHANTEFFSDYGVYDVTITLPERFVLGATGREVDRRANDDGTVSVRYVQEDVHGFTWTASPDFMDLHQRFEVPGLPPVDMRLLLQPEHSQQAERHFHATAATLEHYGKWYGAYPYRQITIVDPAWGSGVGGMEYPTLFTAGTSNFSPFGGGRPEGVTVHEAGHQFWYGLVGNNEFEHAWLDEGLNTFSTARVMDEVYGASRWVERYLSPPGTRIRGFLPIMFDDLRRGRMVSGNRMDRAVKSTVRTADPQSTPTFRAFPPEASNLSYGKTAQWLATLERHLGWETLREILSTFFERYRFKHPRPEDFFAVANEVSGQDLSWYFDQVYNRSVIFDYAIDSVKSFPAAARGLVESADGGLVFVDGDRGSDGPRLFRTEVAVRRHGGGIFPVDVQLVFEDGSEVRVPWSGKERWTLMVEERASKLDYAIVDPDRVLLMDLEYTNNSRLRKPDHLAARKWTSKWMLWLQDFLLTFTFFV